MTTGVVAPLGTYYYIVLSQMSTSTSKCYIAVYFKAKWRCSCGPSWAKTHRYTFIYLHLSLEDVTHIPSCTRFLSRRQYTNNTQRLHLSLFLSFFLSFSLSLHFWKMKINQCWVLEQRNSSTATSWILFIRKYLPQLFISLIHC